jgi:protein gp37
MGKSKIPYIDWVLNNITGCTAMSDGCANCYAKVMYERFDKSGLPFSDVRIDMNLFGKRLLEIKDKKQMVVGVNFMADTFHKEITDKQIDDMITMLNTVPHHHYVIFTKRYERVIDYVSKHDIPKNINLGVSICNKNDACQFHYEIQDNRCDYKFVLSIEPLLEDVKGWDIQNIIQYFSKLVIVGAESLGNKGGREYKESWALYLKELCKKFKVPFYHKQQFINNKKTHLLDGKEYLDNPLRSK